MSRRIEIELTSKSGDGDYTWRAAGARQPKGTLAASLAPSGASVGDVVRVEVEQGMEGIEIIEVLPPRGARADEQRAQRIEVIGVPQRGPDVSVTLAPGSRRREGDGGRATGPRRAGPPRGGAPRERPREGAAGGARAPGEGPRGGGPRRDGPRREGPGREGPRRDGPRRPGVEDDEGGRRTDPAGGRPAADRRPAPAARRERRSPVSTAHRNALLASLPSEQLPVAEQLLRGGIPAVRQAIEEQNAAAKAAGTPPASSDALLKMGESLLAPVKLAEWKDRATSAQAAGRDLRLRELRAVVAASRTVTLDEEGRALAKALREGLEGRVNSLRDEWVARITTALDEDRVLDALRISIRPPEPGTRCPAELAVRLAAAAGAAMTADRAPGEWLDLLQAAAESPVRRTVKPEGVPPGEETQAAARRAAGLVPELAKLLGLRIPPPPPRRIVARRPLSPTGGGGRATGP